MLKKHRHYLSAAIFWFLVIGLPHALFSSTITEILITPVSANPSGPDTEILPAAAQTSITRPILVVAAEPLTTTATLGETAELVVVLHNEGNGDAEAVRLTVDGGLVQAIAVRVNGDPISENNGLFYIQATTSALPAS